MDSKPFSSEWIDRYVRGELEADELERFELELMESAELQQEVEAALAVRQALRLADEAGAPQDLPFAKRPAVSSWQPLALAASVLLAVVSTTLLWRALQHEAALRAEIEALRQPRGEVRIVALERMRGGSTGGPDIVVKRPAGNGLILLEIEAPEAALALERVPLALLGEDGATLNEWTARPGSDGRILSALDASVIPVGRYRLRIGDGQGAGVDYLVEIR